MRKLQVCFGYTSISHRGTKKQLGKSDKLSSQSSQGIFTSFRICSL